MILPSLNWKQRLILKVRGRVFVYTKRRNLGSLPYYVARCRLHGLFVDYPHSWSKELRCPKCISLVDKRDLAQKMRRLR